MTRRGAARHVLDNKDEPRMRGPLIAGLMALAVMAAWAAVGHQQVGARRIANIETALQARGYSDAVVRPIKGPACWRAREGFLWQAGQAKGWACAGPGDEVTLHTGPWTGRWP